MRHDRIFVGNRHFSTLYFSLFSFNAAAEGIAYISCETARLPGLQCGVDCLMISAVLVLTVYISCLLNAAASANSPCCPVSQLHFVFVCHCMHTPRNKQMMMMMMSSSVSTHCISVSDGGTNSVTQHRPNYTAIVVKFEEINLKFRKVRKSFFLKFKIHIQSQQYCYRTTISIVCIVTMLKCVQYNALQQGS